MNKLPHYYPANFKMRSQDPSTLRIIDIWSFRSEKSNKRYIVEVEYFSDNFHGLKFYWKGVATSKERYSLLTNDYEPRRIVMSCIMIMFHYLENNRCASSGFVAASDLNQTSRTGYPNKRFRFYRRLMLTLFGPETFIQAYDLANSLYLLINRKELESSHISISHLEKEISLLYEGVYSILIDE